jgi:hypothetical protein
MVDQWGLDEACRWSHGLAWYGQGVKAALVAIMDVGAACGAGRDTSVARVATMVTEVPTIGELVGVMGGGEGRTRREQGVQVVRRGGVAVGWRGNGAVGLIEDDVLRDHLGVRG